MKATRFTTVIAGMCLVLTGCGGDAEPRFSEQDLPRNFEGGCNGGIKLFVQNQFTPYGGNLHDGLKDLTNGTPIKGNKPLQAVGWYNTGEALYPKNPAGIKAKVWYYVPSEKSWIADAAVRSVKTEPAKGDQSRFFTEAMSPKRPDSCKLTRAN